jgi:hypothetical protein
VDSTHPPQNHRVDFVDFFGTAANRRGTAASNRRTSDFNGLTEPPQTAAMAMNVRTSLSMQALFAAHRIRNLAQPAHGRACHG